VEIVVVLTAVEESLLHRVARPAVAVGRRVEVVQVRRHLRHAEAAVLGDRRQVVVSPDQRAMQVAEHQDRTGGQGRILDEVGVAEVEPPDRLLRQAGVDHRVRVRPDVRHVEVLGLERPGLAGAARVMGLGAALEGQARGPVDVAVRLGGGRVREPRVRRRVARGQHGQDRERLDERRQRRERSKRARRAQIGGHALLAEQEPAADPAAGHQSHADEIAPGQPRLHHLLALGERAQRGSIAAVAQQGTHGYVPPSSTPIAATPRAATGIGTTLERGPSHCNPTIV
jgi:hypothetical protein